MRAIDAELARLSRAPQLIGNSYLALANALARGELEAALEAEARRRMLLEERAALLPMLSLAQAVAGQQSGYVMQLEQRRISAHQREVEARRKVRLLEERSSCRLPFSDCASDLDKAHRELIDANAEAWRTFREHRDAKVAASTLRRPAVNESVAVLRVDRSGIQDFFGEISREVVRIESWNVIAAKPIRRAAESALVIVASALAMGVVLKVLFYFGLAWMAARRPPFVIRKGSSPQVVREPSRSSLSRQLALVPGQELIIMGSHLQSVGDGASTRTRWLLSRAYPLTSLLSGLWMLTRLRARATCTVVLSATTDALEELNTVTLEEGESLVLLPRHLVGVIHPVGRPVALRGCWKVGLHAWLTLQFRYLVLEGPCTLIVGGCRGVRIESAESGRSVSQAMTVGFSPHLAHSVRRTETFIAYLLGQRPLFNDRFQGAGIVLHQEVPSTAQSAGVTGRGLQGVIDGVLKAFGI